MDGSFIKVNVEFTRITGYTTEELNKLSYWDLTPKEYLEEEGIQLKDLSEKKEPMVPMKKNISEKMER